jgi:protein translocase SecG subunit
MANVLIVAYLLIVLALIAVILLQRSEGGGLGMGSSNANGLISVRGSANLLTRTTAILAALFFASAIALTILSSVDSGADHGARRARADAAANPGRPAGPDRWHHNHPGGYRRRSDNGTGPELRPAGSGRHGAGNGSAGDDRTTSGARQLRPPRQRTKEGDGNIPFFFCVGPCQRDRHRP